jgi:regulatory protein
MISPGKLTAIQTQKAHPNRVSLFVNDEFVLGIRRELVFHFNLQVGDTVSEADVLAWQQEEAKANAVEMALKYITSRSKTQYQVLKYLKGKGIEEDAAAHAVSYLDSYGYLDDQQFASDFVRSRIQYKPRGKRVIKWELQQRGIKPDTIEEALDQYKDEVEAARRLVDKKLSTKHFNDREELRVFELKIGRLLARKGFSSSTIQLVMKDVQKLPFLDNDLE